MTTLRTLLAVLLAATLSSAHMVITYPGWRGNNLHSNGTVGVDDFTGYSGENLFPYGMQWMYPCGGMHITTNRTKWPMWGGGVALQPGWFSGHSTAFIYVNLGIGTIPPNYSHPMVPVFQVAGPTNDAYPGKQFCLPQVGLPANITIRPGDNATIQVVEAAKHGAALYSCVDITFTDDMSEVALLNDTNCYNDSSLSFNLVFATVSLTDAADVALRHPNLIGALTIAIGTVVALFWFG